MHHLSCKPLLHQAFWRERLVVKERAMDKLVTLLEGFLSLFQIPISLIDLKNPLQRWRILHAKSSSLSAEQSNQELYMTKVGKQWEAMGPWMMIMIREEPLQRPTFWLGQGPATAIQAKATQLFYVSRGGRSRQSKAHKCKEGKKPVCGVSSAHLSYRPTHSYNKKSKPQVLLVQEPSLWKNIHPNCWGGTIHNLCKCSLQTY